MSRKARATPAAEPSLLLLQQQGLSPLAIELQRHVQNLESDEGFAGVLSSAAAAAAVEATSRAVNVELKRLLEGSCLAASDQPEDFGGGFDMVEPHLTTAVSQRWPQAPRRIRC